MDLTMGFLGTEPSEEKDQDEFSLSTKLTEGLEIEFMCLQAGIVTKASPYSIM